MWHLSSLNFSSTPQLTEASAVVEDKVYHRSEHDPVIQGPLSYLLSALLKKRLIIHNMESLAEPKLR